MPKYKLQQKIDASGNVVNIAIVADYNDLENKPTIPDAVIANPTLSGGEADLASLQVGNTKFKVPSGSQQVQANWNETDNTSPAYIQNKPTLATVATSGSYNDLSNKPTIPSKDSDLTNDRYIRYDTNAQGLNSTQKSNARTNIGAGTSNFSGSYNDLSNKPSLATVATSGNYNDLSNKPTIPSAIHLYAHCITIYNSTWSMRLTLTIINNSNTKFNTTSLLTYLWNNNLRDGNNSYPVSGNYLSYIAMDIYAYGSSDPYSNLKLSYYSNGMQSANVGSVSFYDNVIQIC